MDYLIYDEDGELIDVLHFENHKGLDAYRAKNPNGIKIAIFPYTFKKRRLVFEVSAYSFMVRKGLRLADSTPSSTCNNSQFLNVSMVK